MAQPDARKPLPHLSAPGQCSSRSRLEYVLGKKAAVLPPAPPPPSTSLTPSAFSSLSRPSPSRPHPELLPSPLIRPPSPNPQSMWTAAPRSDSTQTTVPSVQESPPRLNRLPLRYPLTSQSSVYSYDDEDFEVEKSTPIPLHKRPVEEWSATAGVRLADQAWSLRRARDLTKANRRLIKDVVFEVLEDQCEIEDESEAHVIGTSIVTLALHCFTDTIDAAPLSLLALVDYIGRYIELLSSPQPSTYNPPHRRPHPPPSSRRLRSVDHELNAPEDDLHFGGIIRVEGIASTSLGTTERTRKFDSMSRGSSRTEMTSQLTEARQQLADSQLKIQDLEDRCERLRMRVDGHWMEWEAREREVREGLYSSVENKIASSRALGGRMALEQSINLGCPSTEWGRHDHAPFDQGDPLPSRSSSSSSSFVPMQHPIQSSIYSPGVQPSVASYSSEGIIERLLTLPPLSHPSPLPHLASPSQPSTLIATSSTHLASSSSPLVNAATVPVSPPPPPSFLPSSSSQLNWLSSSPTTPSTVPSHLQQAPHPPPPPFPNLNPCSPPPSPSTLTFTPAHVRTSPRLLYPLKSCLKMTRPPSPPRLPTQTSATMAEPKLNSPSTIDSSPPPSSSLKRRRNGLEPVHGFQPTPIVKPDGYRLPGRLVKRVRG